MKYIYIIRKIPILFCLVFSLTSVAQVVSKPVTGQYDYKKAIGFRIGETSGFTYKHFFTNGNAFEGIVGVWPYAFSLTGLYEKHLKTGAPGLLWYFGAGGHANLRSRSTRAYYGYYYERRYTYVNRSGSFGLGVDGIIGMEYKFRPIPLGLSADLKPYTEINDYGNIYISIDPSIGVKFTFK